MATAKRAPARGKRVRAKRHANSHTKPLPRPHGNRIVFSPALIADIRRRYENTPETFESLVIDLGASRSTLRNIALSENWVRFVPPPRGLSRAAEIAAKAEALEALPEETRDDGQGAGAEAPAWSLRERIDELRNAVDDEIAAVRALRARLKGVPHSADAAGRTARTLADLTTTLERLHRLEIGASQHNGQSTYDDTPADADEFRDELARRIRAFVKSRTGKGDVDGNSGPAVMADAP